MKITNTILLFLIGYSSSFAQNTQLSDNLKKHVTILASDSLEGRGLGTKGATIARNYIIQEFERAGIAPLGGEYKHSFRFRNGIIWVTGVNIAAIIEGSDPVLKSEYIVIGAHYDHLGYSVKKNDTIVFNGADDNASGVATLIETGKLLKQSGKSLKRSVILVAFDGEEVGLFGSGEFVKDPFLDLTKVKCMFSLDMTGMYAKNKGVYLHGIYNLLNGKEILASTLAQTDSVNVMANDHIIKRTDTYSFAEKGIPAIHVFTGTKSPYHKPADDSYLLDYPGMAKITLLTNNLVCELANTAQISATKKIEKYPEKNNAKFTTAFNLSVGNSNHNYKDAFYNGKKIMALNLGLTGNYKLTGHMQLQSGIFAYRDGSRRNLGNVITYGMETPLNVLFSSENSKSVYTYFVAGGYYKHVFKGIINGETIAFSDVYKSNTLGFQAGFGLQVYNLNLGISWKYGITNFNATGNSGAIYERSAYLTVGFQF